MNRPEGEGFYRIHKIYTDGDTSPSASMLSTDSLYDAIMFCEEEEDRPHRFLLWEDHVPVKEFSLRNGRP